jgi:hypothetical protein
VPDNVEVSSGTVYNNLGQLVKTVKLEGTTMADISNLPQGVYYIKITGSGQNKVLPFVKE